MFQAIHVKNTWGSHCDKLLFMSTQEDSHLGAVKLLGAEEGRQGLWGKTKRAFKYVYENHFDEYEWFLKADDDTFVVVENLKAVLANHSTNDPIAFGHNYKYLGVREGRPCIFAPNIFVSRVTWLVELDMFCQENL